MSLFSKKTKEFVYDKEESEKKKKLIREIFDEAVEDGASYRLFLASELSSKFEKGFFIDTNTTTYYYYIFGYRENDQAMIMVQVDAELVNYSEPFSILVDSLKDISYDKKYDQVCLEYKKGFGSYGEVLKIHDYSNKTICGIQNLYQEEERNAFLDFLETVRDTLEKNGMKLSKWKR